ncbi:phage_NlpC_fam, putative phage cell wall peptidase, NlpC/P60 family [Rhabdaerophilaceae bacterium]
MSLEPARSESSGTDGDFRAKIVEAARGWIGTPYRHQASLRGQGADCLGLLRGVWRDVLGPEPEPLPAYSAHWNDAPGNEPLLDLAHRRLVACEANATLRPGRVILFRWRPDLPVRHCAIATGLGHFVHAHDRACVAEVALHARWRRQIAGLFDFPMRRT